MNHVLLKPSLERWGLTFDSAYNGEEGISQARKLSYDFILVDLQMPGKSGAEVIEELAKDGHINADAHIILCTANAMVKSFKPELLKLVDASLLKPFKEYEVAQLLAGLSSKNRPKSPIKIMKKAKPLYSLTNFRAYAGDDPEVLVQFLISFIKTNHENLDFLKKHFKNQDYSNVGDTAIR